MIIGSHVSFKKDQLLGSVKEALSYGANTFMFYTGAPQNTLRSALDEALTKEAQALIKENNMDINNIICHAPYIINLASNKDATKYDFSINFLKKELTRCEELNIKYLVLHPGSSVGLDSNIALDNIVFALNQVLATTKTTVLLETMAGKGSELGGNLEEINYLLNHITYPNIGVCLDTCHLHDAGYDLSNFDAFLQEFDAKVGLKYLKCIHLNDSKNPLGAKKDRHENIGLGHLGFSTILNILNHPSLKDIPFILETPYIGEADTSKDRLYPPYRFEIAMLKKGEFNPNLYSDIRQFYQK